MDRRAFLAGAAALFAAPLAIEAQQTGKASVISDTRGPQNVAIEYRPSVQPCSGICCPVGQRRAP